MVGSLLARRGGFTLSFAFLIAAAVFEKIRRYLRKKAVAQARKRWLRLSSPLYGSMIKFQKPHQGKHVDEDGNVLEWQGFCPCCKRPVDARLSDELPPPTVMEDERKGKYAYVITLWGTSKTYVLGALVLGHSLKANGAKHKLICLHTDDVPEGFIALLERVWECRLIQHIESTKTLSWEAQADRFEHVFTKLRAMSMTEFEKVLMMDIDLLVMSNIDELFDLPAPAALQRGMNPSTERGGPCHGKPIDGRLFFLGAGHNKGSWGQGTGINAGVMLLEPNQATYEAMLAEVQDDKHPEHIKGNGPEQDYLSRYWADKQWTNMGVEYNYQLHQMYFSLNPYFIQTTERMKFLQDPSLIKVVHFSGEPLAKPWHRVLDEKYAMGWPDRSQDAQYVDMFSEEFKGHWLWVRRDRAAWNMVHHQNKRAGAQLRNFHLGDDGNIYQTDNYNVSSNDRSAAVPADLPESALLGTQKVLEHVLGRWFENFLEIQDLLGVDLPEALKAAAPKPATDGKLAAGEVSEYTWKQTWFLGEPGKPFAANPQSPQKYHDVEKIQTSAIRYRRRSGWLYEQVSWSGIQATQSPAAVASVMCGVGDCEGANFAVFNDAAGTESFFPDCEDNVCGVFLKVSGQAPRHFELNRGDLSGMQFWVSGVGADAMVLLAIVGLDDQTVANVLEVLEVLGVPQGPVDPGCRALAAAGPARSKAPWSSAHASAKAAYASIQLPSEENEA